MLPYPAFSKSRALDNTKMPRRVYGVLGDAFLQNRVIASLLEWSVDEDARDFNLDTLDGEGTAISEVLAHCGNLPFLAEHRAVVVKRAEKMEGLGRSEDGEAKPAKKSATKTVSPAKKLAEGLENLPATTVLILARSPETPDPGARASTPRCINAAVDKILENLGVIVDCTVDAKNSGLATALVENEATLRDIPLANGAAAYLVERCGNDVARLLSELEKCALNAGIGEMVTPAIIDEMTRRAPHETVFNLTDAIGERRGAHALELVRELVENGEPPELLLALLVRHLRQLLQARTFLDAGLSLDNSLARRLPPQIAAQLPKDGRDNLATALQSNSWMGRRLSGQARNFSVPQLQRALELALEADLAFKGIEGDGGFEAKRLPGAALELLVARLCG